MERRRQPGRPERHPCPPSPSSRSPNPRIRKTASTWTSRSAAAAAEDHKRHANNASAPSPTPDRRRLASVVHEVTKDDSTDLDHLWMADPEGQRLPPSSDSAPIFAERQGLDECTGRCQCNFTGTPFGSRVMRRLSPVSRQETVRYRSSETRSKTAGARYSAAWGTPASRSRS